MTLPRYLCGFFHYSIQVSAFKCHNIREDFVILFPQTGALIGAAQKFLSFSFSYFIFLHGTHQSLTLLYIHCFYVLIAYLAPLKCKFLAIKTLSCSLLYFPCLEECLAHNRNSMSLLNKWMNPGSYNFSV